MSRNAPTAAPADDAQSSGALIGVRADGDFLAALDRWREAQPVPPSRPAALRYLTRSHLAILPARERAAVS